MSVGKRLHFEAMSGDNPEVKWEVIREHGVFGGHPGHHDGAVRSKVGVGGRVGEEWSHYEKDKG
jgi:hypothetical protein